MNKKRFYVAKSNLIDGYCVFDREKKYAFSPKPREADCLNDAHTLNELHEENQDLKSFGEDLAENLSVCANARISKDNLIEKLTRENERLKYKINDLLYQIEYVGKNNKSCDGCECFLEDIEYCWMWDMNVKKEDIVVACDQRKVKNTK